MWEINNEVLEWCQTRCHLKPDVRIVFFIIWHAATQWNVKIQKIVVFYYCYMVYKLTWSAIDNRYTTAGLFLCKVVFWFKRLNLFTVIGDFSFSCWFVVDLFKSMRQRSISNIKIFIFLKISWKYEFVCVVFSIVLWYLTHFLKLMFELKFEN